MLEAEILPAERVPRSVADSQALSLRQRSSSLGANPLDPQNLLFRDRNNLANFN